MDVKRFARFQRPGHRVTGDRYRSAKEKRAKVGWEFAHSMIDDHSRLVYTELHCDEQAGTVTGFVERALAFYASHAISVTRLQTDNHFSYAKNRSLRQAPEYPASATTVTFTAGVGTASALKLSDAQNTPLKVKEGATVVGTSGSFTVKAAAAERFAWSHAEATAGAIEAGTCPFACKTTSIGNSKAFKAHASVTDKYGNIVSNLGGASKAKIEKTSGEGTLANATGLTIPTSGLAESTSPASGISEAVLKLKSEEGTAYTEAEAHIKY